MRLCEYGCGREATYLMKNGKWCCSKHWNNCPQVKKNRIGKKRTTESKKRMSDSHKGQIPWNKGQTDIYSDESKSKMGIRRFGCDNPFFNKQHTDESKKKMRNARKGKTYKEIYGDDVAEKIIMKRKGKTYDKIYGLEKSIKIRTKQSKSLKNSGRVYETLSIEYIKNKYQFFSQIEEMRYNPDKPGEKEIQVHCKNHNCPNSKEQGGWFTPTYIQLYERIRKLEHEGVDYSYMYCCDECKKECPLYALKGADPFKDINLPYTQEEYKTFRDFVLERDEYKCQYCGKKAEHVHHERPQKLEPFHALDPDLAWSVCKECHYKYGHKDECSTVQIANIVCK